jgi:hypothetical protein
LIDEVLVIPVSVWPIFLTVYIDKRQYVPTSRRKYEGGKHS